MLYDAVLLMVPPWEPNIPPLGLAYIAEYLISKGVKTKVLDFNLHLYRNAAADKTFFWDISNINFMSPNEIAAKMFNTFRKEIDSLIGQIISMDSTFVGFSVNVASIVLACKIAKLIKKKNKNKVIIFGGTGCFWHQDRHLIPKEDFSAIDAIVIGEGEIILERLICGYKNSGKLEKTNGVILRKEDFLKPTEPFHTSDIDALPFPTFSDFELSIYRQSHIPMVISRGCIGKCSFCIDHLMCGTYRWRSPVKIIEEIKYHITTNKINTFQFNDLICNGNLKQLDGLCDLIIGSKLKISWGSYAMIRKEMNIDLLKKMHKAGCNFLCYGVESGSDTILKKMNKFYTSDDAQEVLRATHEAEIRAAINIIVGFPGETEYDFQQTLSFIKRNKGYICEITNVSSFVFMPASRIGKSFKEFGVEFPFDCPNLNFFRDENGLDLNGRLQRVRKTIFTVSNLGIRNVIINHPTLEKKNRKKNIVLLSLPPARTDILPFEIAAVYAYLKNKNFNPIIYDLNIKLFNSLSSEFKYLWENNNWHAWNIPSQIISILDKLSDDLFNLSSEIVSLEDNMFCFWVNRYNFSFAAKLALIFKKWTTCGITIIFVSPLFRDKMILTLIPKGIADILVTDKAEEALGKILGNNYKTLRDIPNITVYNDGEYRETIKSEFYSIHNSSANFDGFHLNEYDNLQLPLSWNK